MLSAIGFWWRGSAGYRLRPWRSPYLRWRLETYTGKKAESLRLRDFLSVGMAERRQVWRFFQWTGELRRLARGDEGR